MGTTMLTDHAAYALQLTNTYVSGYSRVHAAVMQQMGLINAGVVFNMYTYSVLHNTRTRLKVLARFCLADNATTLRSAKIAHRLGTIRIVMPKQT